MLNDITEENIAGPLYLQGLRLDNYTFEDDEGRQITYFKWDDGEPDTGNYLRTDRNTYLQKTASGSGSYRLFAAYIEWSSLRRRLKGKMMCTYCDLIFNVNVCAL